MAKNIILLSDGTGSGAAKLFKANVWRLYQALELTESDQLACYDDGVGTSTFKPLAALGGAVGYGLKRNVRDLYMFLCRHYRPGDRIYGFGFSRGAFTIRQLMGMVARQGLVPYNNSESELRRNAKGAYRTYRRGMTTNRYTSWFTVGLLRGVRDLVLMGWYSLRGFKRFDEVEMVQVPSIRFLGLCDTVDAYGLPLDEMTRGIDLWIWPLSFADQELNKKVERACHAISLDDERTTFHPVLWNEANEQRVFPGTRRSGKSEKPITSVKHERLSQVWFAGVHTDVGGGYPDDALAHVPLKWIMDEAAELGVIFMPDARKELAERAVPLGPIHNSRSGLARYYRYGPRKIELLCDDTIDRDSPVHIEWPKIHESAFARIKARSEGYAPIVLPERYAVVMENGEIRAGPYSGQPISAKPNPFEDGSQSVSRAHVQEKVWDYVWYRRVAYFATLFATVYLVLFPLIHDNKPDWAAAIAKFILEPIKNCVLPYLEFVLKPIGLALAAIAWPVQTVYSWVESYFKLAVEYAVKAAQAFVPGAGYLEAWFKSYQDHHGWFTFGVLALFACVLAGSFLRARIYDRMRTFWRPIIASGPKPVPVAPAPSGLLYRIRMSDAYLYALEYTKWYLLPTIFAAIIVYLAVMLFLYGWNALVN